MDDHPWFQQLRSALRKNHVPKRYSNRLIAELWLHYLEMQEQDKMNGFSTHEEPLAARLGSPEILAAAAADVPRTTWSGRHPWLAFIVGAPFVALALIVVCLLVVAIGITPIAEGKTLSSDPWLGPFMNVLGPIQVILPSILAAWLICRAVDRSVRSHWWGVVGCGLIALLSAMTVIHWMPPATTAGTGSLSFGISFPIGSSWFQAIAPLVVGTIYAGKNLPPRETPQEEPPVANPFQSAA